MALCLPVAFPTSTAFKCRLAPAHNARVADEKADALSETHRLFSSATPAPLVRHSRHTSWVSDGHNPQIAEQRPFMWCDRPAPAVLPLG